MSVMAQPEAVKTNPSSRGERFVSNVLWSWIGVFVSLVTGVFLSRYIVLKLGSEGYGVWALTYSIVTYYGLFDLGFRSAVVRYSAHYLARGETDKINELINTGLGYFSVVSVILLLASVFLYRHAHRFFQVSPELRNDFSILVLVVGISLALGVNLNVFSGCVEGFQRFDIANRMRILTQVVRVIGCFALLAMGYKLVALGIWALVTQTTLYIVFLFVFWRMFPALRLARELMKFSMLKHMAHFGIHTFVAGGSEQSLEQMPSLMIGHFRPTSEVGYYNLPLRLLQYAADAVTRVGIVASPQAAELAAEGRLDAVARLGICANRYCLVLYLPLTIVLLVWGSELIHLWVGAEFARNSGPLLPVLVAGTALVTAGQFASSTILFGLAKHQRLAYGLLVEAVLCVGALAVVIPRYGIFGAAVVTSALMLLVRGVYVSWLLCHYLDFPYWRYMREIFVRPLALAVPILALAALSKARFLSGRNWPEMLGASAGVALLYLGSAFFLCVDLEHRELLFRWVNRQWAQRREGR